MDVENEQIFKNPNVNITYDSDRREVGDDMVQIISYLSFNASFFIPFSETGRDYLKGDDAATKESWFEFTNFIHNDIGRKKGSKKNSEIYNILANAIDKINLQAIVAAAKQVKIDFPNFDKNKDFPKMILKPNFLEPFFSASKDPPGIFLRFESYFDAPRADVVL